MSAEETPVMISAGIALPPVILQRFYNFHGRETTNAWLRSVSSTLGEWCRTWQIELEQIEPPDTFNVVLFGHSQKMGDVVLKINPPTFESLAELEAVRQASGPGFVRLIDADPGAARRRVVVVADVPDAEVTPKPQLERAVVELSAAVPLSRVAAVHADTAEAEPAVRAAANVVLEADLGSDDAQFVVDGAEGYELAWYATQEIGALIELL